MNVILLISILLWPAVSPAQPDQSHQTADVRALIEQALDETGKTIELNDVPLKKAFDVIAEQTGVELGMAPEAVNLIPHGAETRVTARIANLPLREGLNRLFGRLGMELIVLEDHVEVIPQEALLRLGRPATWEELDTLTALSQLQPGLETGDLGQLRTLLQFHVDVSQPWDQLARAVQDAGAGSADEVLDAACGRFGWTWILSGKHVVVIPVARLIEMQLQQPVSIRLSSRPLIDILRALSHKLNLRIRTEPGAIAALPIEVQQGFNLIAQDNTGEEVLDAIAASTGMGYLIEPEGVLFYQPVPGGGGAGSQGDTRNPNSVSANPYLGQFVRVLEDGTEVRWLIRASDLPADLRPVREADIARMVELLRREREAAEAEE